MIPLQLKNHYFCRVRKGKKKPFEIGWPNILYNYDQIQEYFPKENYGVLTGINGFGALDDDTPDKELLKLYDENFPETMQVRGHYYLNMENWNEDKILFEHPTKVYLNKKREWTHDMGELQGKGQQVVGAGSLHESGETYKLIKDLSIVKIDFSKFKEVFKNFIKVGNRQIIKEWKKTEWEGDRIENIPLTNIFSIVGLTQRKNILQGSHPVHGSQTGSNFIIDTSKNQWCCFHGGCKPPHGGGGSWSAIAMMEGLIDCSVTLNLLPDDVKKKVAGICREKYGLKSPGKKQVKILGEPKGWAKSINISKMAIKYNLLNCPSCNNSFKFENEHGFYYCSNCKYGGGLKKFALLCVQSSKKKKVKNDARN